MDAASLSWMAESTRLGDWSFSFSGLIPFPPAKGTVFSLNAAYGRVNVGQRRKRSNLWQASSRTSCTNSGAQQKPWNSPWVKRRTTNADENKLGLVCWSALLG